MENLPVLSMDIKELSKVEDNLLNVKQLNYLLAKTPENHIYRRPAKGGGQWSFVTGIYVKKALNFIFGWDWDFQIEKFETNLEIKQCIVLGKLTVRTKGRAIIKMQFGRADIKFKSEAVFDKEGKPIFITDKFGNRKQKKQPSNIPLDLGNDLKAASTDALKKCASELGVASDIYGANEFKEIKVVDTPPDLTEKQLEILFELQTSDISEEIKESLKKQIQEGKEDKVSEYINSQKKKQ